MCQAFRSERLRGEAAAGNWITASFQGVVVCETLLYTRALRLSIPQTSLTASITNSHGRKHTRLPSPATAQWSTKSSSGAASVHLPLYDSTPGRDDKSDGKLTSHVHRPRRPILATRHRNAALLQPGISLGIPCLRRSGGQFRVLVDGRREQTVQGSQ